MENENKSSDKAHSEPLQQCNVVGSAGKETKILTIKYYKNDTIRKRYARIKFNSI